MMLLFVALYASSLFISFLSSTEHWIIIHGTFAKNNTWHAEDSEERKILKKRLAEDRSSGEFHIHSFVWSGHNNHKARLSAAKEYILFLEKILKESKHPSRISFHVIGHSHGATIALLAAQLLVEQKQSLCMAELFCLGIPIHISWYPDAHKNIKCMYNLFSYGDGIQPLGGVFQRIFPEYFFAYNIQVLYDFSCPSHTEMHEPKLLSHLPNLHKASKHHAKNIILHIKKADNAKSFHLFMAADDDREKDLIADKAFTHQILGLFSETRLKLSRIKKKKIEALKERLIGTVSYDYASH